MYWPANSTPAVACLLVAIAMGSWFASEAVKEKKENGKYYTSMVLMIVAAIGALFFGIKVLNRIRNGNAGGNYAPVPNMPSNAAGAANVPAPGAPVPNAATNAAAVKITVA
jgi:hypothetical protein